MKKKVIAFLTLLVMVASLCCAVGPTVVRADTGKLRVGYAVISIDPVDQDGTFRKIDYSGVLESTSSGYSYLQGLLAEAGVTTDNPYYTVPVLPFDCDNNGTTDDGYFSVPLAGYGETYNRMSQGKTDDNGDKVIDEKDGSFATCIAVTDEHGQTLLFFSMDLISAANAVVNTAKNNVQSALRADYGYVPMSNMTFNASHTHSSPDIGINNTSNTLEANAAQRAYLALLQDRFVKVAKAAMADRREVTVSRGSMEATNMNATRHYNVYHERSGRYISTIKANWVHGDNFGGYMPLDTNIDKSPVVSGTVTTRYEAQNVSQSDQSLLLLQFTPTDGSDPIVMVNWRAHPKTNSTNSTQYGKDHRDRSSGDYVVMLREKLLKYGYRAAFMQGAAGNQNTWNYIDDGVLGPRAEDSYAFVSTYHEPVADKTSTAECHNDRMAFIRYYSAAANTTTNVQTSYTYGGRLADYALAGLYKNMQSVKTGTIKTNQVSFSADPQIYSDGLRAAVAAYDAATSKSFPFKYLHTDGKYYNLNSVYHANSVRSRSTDATKVDNNLELNCITIGELAFLTAPNELYDRYNFSGDQVNNNLWDNLNDEGYGVPFVLAYTNGAEGYIPNVAAYEYNRANNDAGSVKTISGSYISMGVGAYEANTSKFAPGAGEKICQTYEQMLQQMDDLQRTTTCSMCGATNVQWDAICDPSITQLYSGHYYLSGDMTGGSSYQKTVPYGNTVCLDLNGKTFANGSSITGRAFNLSGNATLRVINGEVHGRGIDTGTEGGTVYMASNSTLEMTNVTLVRDVHEGQTSNKGGVIYVGKKANLTLKDCTISGGAATVSGGNLYADENANVTLQNVTMEGGKSDNTGDNLTSYRANMHISGNSVLKGESYFSGGTPVISGNVQICQSDTGVNVHLSAGTKLTFGELEKTARIGVTGKAMITDAAGVQYADRLIADSGYLDASFSSGIFAGEIQGCACRGKATQKHTCEYHAWTVWTSSTSLPTVGNYYLKNNVSIMSEADVNYDTLRLDLNGKTITRKVFTTTDTRVFDINSSGLLTITDTSGGGIVQRDVSVLSAAQQAAITDYGLIVCLNNSSRFHMYAGTLDGKGLQTRGGVVAGTTGDTQIHIYGGTIKGAAATYLSGSGGSGGALYAQGKVSLYGGTITGGKAEKNGGGVYVASGNGQLTLTGDASVTGNYKKDGTTASNIYCAADQLTVLGAYTGTAGITVSSPAEGKQAGNSNGANLTGASLTVDGTSDYKFYAQGTALKLTLKTMEAYITNGADTQYYQSLTEALTAYPGAPAVLHLMCDVSKTLTVKTDMVLDLAGCHVTGGITFENSAKLAVCDSNTDDYTVQDGAGYGTVPAVSGVQAADGYMMIAGDDQTLSFHKICMDMSEVNLRIASAGVYYAGRFCGDEMVAPRILEYGIALSITGVPTAQEILADTDGKTHVAYTSSLGAGVRIEGVLTENIIAKTNSYAVNKYHAGQKIYGVPYIKTADGIQLGKAVAYSLRDVVEAVDDIWQDLTASQKAELISWYDSYVVFMRFWDVKNLHAAWSGK